MGKTLCRTRSARYQTQVTIKSVYNTSFKKRSLGGCNALEEPLSGLCKALGHILNSAQTTFDGAHLWSQHWASCTANSRPNAPHNTLSQRKKILSFLFARLAKLLYQNIIKNNILKIWYLSMTSQKSVRPLHRKSHNCFEENIKRHKYIQLYHVHELKSSLL